MGSSSKKSPKKKHQQQSSVKAQNVITSPRKSAVVSQEHSLTTSQEVPQHWNEHGWLELSVRQTETKANANGISMAHDEHVLSMHHSDAQLMRVTTGDKVLVLHIVKHDLQKLVSEDKQYQLLQFIPFAALCTIKILGLASSNSSKKKLPLRQGTFRLSPKCLEERFVRTIHSLSDGNDSAGIPTIKSQGYSTPLKTPSPSKSKFSFSKGGGGDAIISPTTKERTSEKKIITIKKDKASTSPSVATVLPYNQNCSFAAATSIGHQLVSLHASSLTLELSQTSNTTQENKSPNDSLILKGNKLILEKLAVAALHGTFLQKGDTVIIPFRGLKRTFVVIDVVGIVPTKTEKDFKQVHESFSKLSLEKENLDEKKQHCDIHLVTDEEEDDNPSDHKTRFLRTIQFRHKSEASPLLFAVTYNTKVLFSSPLCTNADSVLSNVKCKLPTLNVGGLSQILHTLKSSLETPLFRPDLFQGSSALRVPRGVLLFGPSGVGKTALTHQLTEELSNIGASLQIKVQIQRVQCQSLISSSVVGENERILSSLFSSNNKAARNNTSTLLILDDIHLICPRRGNNRTTDQISSTLLSLMDGIDTVRGNLVILGITRAPSDLDPALRRPGRLDVEVEIPIPDDTARADIFRVQISRFAPKLHPQLNAADYLSLAKKAKGFTGADTLLSIKESVRMSLLCSSEHNDTRDAEITITLDLLFKAMRSVVPSTLRTSPQALVEIPTVRWSDIGGMHDPKTLLREAISLPLTHADMFTRLGISPPKGVLLYGPPGCSKTLLARALATEGQMNFMAVKGPELLSKWLGESERALAGLFRRARQASPCVVFFDEVDAIAGKRGSGDGGGGGERILSQLLTELDGVQGRQQHHRVVVVGATNRPDLLDGALMRPGRIDRKIYVGVPDQQSRECILNIGLSNGKRCGSDIDISALAGDDYTEGFSGAEIVAICREAALYAIEEDEEVIHSGNPMICMRHMVKSIKGMKRQITPEMLEFYARFQRAGS